MLVQVSPVILISSKEPFFKDVIILTARGKMLESLWIMQFAVAGLDCAVLLVAVLGALAVMEMLPLMMKSHEY